MQVNWIGKVLLRMYLTGKWKLLEWPPCILKATNKLWYKVLAKRLTNKTERKTEAEVSYEFEKVKPLQEHFQTEMKTKLGQQSHQIWWSEFTLHQQSTRYPLRMLSVFLYTNSFFSSSSEKKKKKDSFVLPTCCPLQQHHLSQDIRRRNTGNCLVSTLFINQSIYIL